MFKSLGTFVAKALLDSRIVDMPFSPIFLEMVIGEEEEEESAAEQALGPAGRKGAQYHLLRVCVVVIVVAYESDEINLCEPTQHVDPTLYTSLLDLKKYVHAKQAIDADTNLSAEERQLRLAAVTVKDAHIEDLCIDFTLPGYSNIELMKGGKDIAVTLENVEHYVDRVIQMTVGNGVRRQVEAFRKGFDRVFPVTDLRSFSVQELTLLVGGSEDEDWSTESKCGENWSSQESC